MDLTQKSESMAEENQELKRLDRIVKAIREESVNNAQTCVMVVWCAQWHGVKTKYVTSNFIKKSCEKFKGTQLAMSGSISKPYYAIITKTAGQFLFFVFHCIDCAFAQHTIFGHGFFCLYWFLKGYMCLRTRHTQNTLQKKRNTKKIKTRQLI